MQKIIIIGATSGIGRALAKLYAVENNLVAATGRRKEMLDSLHSEHPENIITECFDVTANNNIEHLKSILQQLGGMDIFIYNSGYGEISKKLDWELDRQITHTNVNGFVEMVNFAFNYFEQQGHGQIAGVSSIASIRGNSWAPAYGASKAFMSNYMEGLNIKSAKQKLNISITDIQPGFVSTKMAMGNKQFWVVPVEKATRQIYQAIKNKRRRAYISRRWWLIAWALNWIPYSIYKRFG